MEGASSSSTEPLWFAKASLSRDLLQLTALGSLAIAHPLFDLLGRYPEFFVVRRSEPEDLVVMAAVLVFLPPSALGGVEALCRLVSTSMQRVVHCVLITLLFVVVCVPPLKRAEFLLPARPWLLAAAMGLAFLLAYIKLELVRRVLTWLSAAAILFPLLFLLSPKIRPVLFPTVGAPEALDVAIEEPFPQVLIIFDEFPVTSIMAPDLGIERSLFPNFGRLADMSYWFRDTQTVSEDTLLSIAAILTGRRPIPGEHPPPSVENYPGNLFTLLGRTYDVRSFEANTQLCPEAFCTDLREVHGFEGRGERLRALFQDVAIVFLHLVVPPPWDRSLPSITDAWSGFADREGGEAQAPARKPPFGTDKELVFETFLRSLQDRRRPTLYFLHSMLPHVPWIYYPSGRTYDRFRYEMEPLVPGLRMRWVDDEDLVWHGYQRHLLQVKFVDELIGRLLERLDRLGLTDQALVVVTADHGASFFPGKVRRSRISGNTFDIDLVPLFVKLPGQTVGQIVDEPRETIDILPTIAKVVGVEIPWAVDGQDLLGGDRPHLRDVPDETKYAMVERVRHRFGDDPLAALYPDSYDSPLLGRDAEGLASEEADGVLVSLEEPRSGSESKVPRVLRVEQGRTVPGLFVGTIGGDLAGLPSREVVIALNGVIEAVTKTYADPLSGKPKFSVILPEKAFVPGENEAQFYVVDRRKGERPLRRLRREIEEGR